MVIIRHSSRRALQSIYTSKYIITNYGNDIKLRIFNTDLCLSQTERSEGKKGMIVKMNKNNVKNNQENILKNIKIIQKIVTIFGMNI